MAGSRPDSPSSKPLRLWPGVVVVALQWLVWLGAPLLVPGDTTAYGALGALLSGLGMFVWWVFFSRASRGERWGAVVLVIVGLLVSRQASHESIRGGAMGFQFFIYALPVLHLAFVAWAVATRRLTGRVRLVTLAATVLLACAVWTLVRGEGITGDGAVQYAWRWAESHEERLLVGELETPGTSAGAPPSTVIREHPEGPRWPGFRGPQRDGVVHGLRIATDWSATPPVELWRRPVGPGWSSMAVAGGRLYTQEQRGDDEVVSCYDTATGEPVWNHRDPIRFEEPDSGAGPRSTPAVDGGRVFTLGATGRLNALRAGDGALLWSRDAAAEEGAELPHWGFASSPLPVGDLLVVHLGGRLLAYDAATGEPRWSGPRYGESYSSPHRLTLGGIEQIVMLGGRSLYGLSPADGTLLWEHAMAGWSVTQPALTGAGELLLARINRAGMASGMRLLAVSRSPEGWDTFERWSSVRMKPHSSDFVVHEGHAYGFDGRILACIGVEDGERCWKGGRYGSGQLLLLADQGLLLVVTEKGELALVEASPEGFTELARVPAITGKTWNHPALAGDVLLLRNGREMAAFRLPANDN